MANQTYRMSITLVDEDGVKASTYQYALIPEAVTGTQLNTILTDWATAVNALSDAGALKLEICLIITADSAGLSATPSGTQEVANTAGMQYNLVGTENTYSTTIPAFKESLESGSNVNTGDSAVIAYNTILTSTILTTGHYTNPDGVVYGTRKATFLGVRKHRRQLHAKSYILG